MLLEKLDRQVVDDTVWFFACTFISLGSRRRALACPSPLRWWRIAKRNAGLSLACCLPCVWWRIANADVRRSCYTSHLFPLWEKETWSSLLLHTADLHFSYH